MGHTLRDPVELFWTILSYIHFRGLTMEINKERIKAGKNKKKIFDIEKKHKERSHVNWFPG